MIERDHKQLIPAGTLRVHAPIESTSTTSMKKDEKARRTLPQNTPDYLITHFLNHPAFVEKRLDGKGVVRTLEPSKPYAYGGIMTIALHDDLISGREESSRSINTYNIYDYDSDIQAEYYRQLIAGLHAQGEIAFSRHDNKNEPAAIILENTQVQISDYTHKMARSIAIPHAHILRLGDWVDPNTVAPSLFSFRAEQKYTQSDELFERFKAFYTLLVPSYFDHLRLRTAPPYGYTLASTIRYDEPIDSQAAAISILMLSNHQLYTDFAEKEINGLNNSRSKKSRQSRRKNPLVNKDVRRFILPQPSYRTYLYYRDGVLNATISPAILSTTGVIEAAEIFLHRSPTHPEIYTHAELGERKRIVEDSLKQKLGDN